VVDVWTEYARLRDDEGWTQERIAKAKGTNRTQVSRRLKWHDNVPKEINEYVHQEKLTEKHLEDITLLCIDAHFRDWLTTSGLWIALAELAIEKNSPSPSSRKKLTERRIARRCQSEG